MTSLQENLAWLLQNFPDIEKSIYRISCGTISAKDLINLRNSLESIPETAGPAGKSLQTRNPLFEIKDIKDLRLLLEKAVNPQVPLSNPEGKIINPGYNKELDDLRDIQENGKTRLKEFQAKEIKRSGINSLKIGYTSVFGYYIEITKANLSSVPADYIRRQTLVNAERFVTPELKEFEEKILAAEEKIFKIESGILQDLAKPYWKTHPPCTTLPPA